MLSKFFIICSGADSDILERCPKSERQKFVGIGATVFFTAVMAFFAAAYALYTVFDNISLAIVLGIIWGLLIFNLDRYIVSTMKKRDRFGAEILQASPRIILAVIIAMVIAKPLELKVFEKEIDNVLLSKRNELALKNQNEVAVLFNSEIDRLKNENQALQASVDAKKAETDALYDIYISEAEGTSGTMKLGKGPVYAEKREKHDAALADYQDLKKRNEQRIAENDTKIGDLRAQEKAAVQAAQPVIDGFDGLMARLEALQELPYLPQLFIFLLFIAIETTPIFAKLFAPKGEYDIIQADAESATAFSLRSKIDHRMELSKAEAAINERVYSSIQSDDEVFQYKKQRVRVFLNSKSDRFFEEQESLL
jgi:hypothetical protein